MSTDHLLITGGTGFIASHLVKQALQRNIKTRTTVRKNTPEKTKHLRELPNADKLLEIVELDLVESPPSVFESMMAGITHVAHTASPFPLEHVEDEMILIKPAVEGTLSVLRAITSPNGSNVKRVVITSSCAAVSGGFNPLEIKSRTFGEKDWSIVDKCSAYTKSKTLAERAAWDFYKNLGGDKPPSFTLSTVNPCLVLGPSLNKEAGSSVDTILRFMNHRLPLVPHLGIGIVDVRDVALSHLRILFDVDDAEKIRGRRFITFAENRWLPEIAQTLKKEFEPMGYSIVTTPMPTAVAWVLSWFNPLVKRFYSLLDLQTQYDASPAKEILGIKFKKVEKSIIDAGHASIYHGLVEKKPGYVSGWPEKEVPE
jgi:nucleoside-diphosphate-sugar epimerase